MVKNLPANAGNVRDVGLIPGLGRSLEGGHGNSFQYSSLENPMDRGAWQATVHRVAMSQTRLNRLSTHTSILLMTFNVTHYFNFFGGRAGNKNMTQRTSLVV